MAKVDVTLTNFATIGLMAFAAIVVIKMVIYSVPLLAPVRPFADRV